jgi:hypothetical protein
VGHYVTSRGKWVLYTSGVNGTLCHIRGYVGPYVTSGGKRMLVTSEGKYVILSHQG